MMDLIRCVLICLLACACGQGEREPRIGESVAIKPPSATPSLDPSLRFVEGATEAGIDFVHETGAFGEKWMPETMGSGVALFDLDGDLDLDLLLVNGTFWPGRGKGGPVPTQRLYRNRGDGTFDDITRAAGLDIALYGMGAAVGDYDGDSDPDIYLTALDDNALLRNDGGRFAEVEAGVAGRRWRDAKGAERPEWSSGAAWLDYDGDGWLDLFVANYVHWSPATDLFTTVDGINKAYATPQQYDGSSCRFYRNRGDGTFVDVTRAAGLWSPQGKSLGVAVADFDDDGWTDLFVANDTQPDFLYRNRGDGTFAEIGLAAGIAFDEAGRARAGMGVDVAEVDNDRMSVLAVGNFSREPLSLHRQAQALVFVDEATRRGLALPTLPTLTFGLLFADLDLDGFRDLVLANGHIEPTVQKVQREIAYAQQPQVFWNDRAGGFVEAAFALESAVVGRGLAKGDIDGDGDTDLVLSTNGGAALLLRNESATGRALRIRLRDRAPNTAALGAQLALTAGDLEQRATVRTGSSYLSQSALAVTFGLGERARADRLVVRWPDGAREVVEDLVAGAEYVIERGVGVVARVAFASE